MFIFSNPIRLLRANRVQWIFYFLSIFHAYISPFTTHHFYRASFLRDEPRYAVQNLSTIIARLIGGTTHTSFDGRGCRVPLFAINPLICDTKSPTIGRFELFEADINIYQNIGQNGYIELYIPVRQIELYFSDKICSPKALPHLITARQRTGLADTVLLFGITYDYQEIDYFDYIDGSFQVG